jgi:16S rRNA processing protein RimM
LSNTDLLEVGCFVGVHGIKGQVKLKSYTEIPESIFDYKDIFLENNNKIIMKLVGKIKQNLICKIENVETRNDAENYRGLKLFVKRDELPKIKENEYYHRDLIGFNVYNKNRESFGEIISFNDFGAGLLIEVKKENKTFYLPMGNNFLDMIDCKQKEVILNLEISFLDN